MTNGVNNNPAHQVGVVGGDEEQAHPVPIQAASNTTETPQTVHARDATMRLADDVTVGDVTALLQEVRELASDGSRQRVLDRVSQQAAVTHLGFDRIAQHSGYDFSRWNNCCSEHSLCTLALLLGSQVNFNLNHYAAENETSSLMDAVPPENVLCLGAQGRPHFGMWFDSLDRDQNYLVRRGTLAGDGHHFVLTYFNGEWYGISVTSNAPIRLTRDGQPIAESCRPLLEPLPGVAWGARFTEYNLLFAPISMLVLAQLNEYLNEQRQQQHEERQQPQQRKRQAD